MSAADLQQARDDFAAVISAPSAAQERAAVAERRARDEADDLGPEFGLRMLAQWFGLGGGEPDHAALKHVDQALVAAWRAQVPRGSIGWQFWAEDAEYDAWCASGLPTPSVPVSDDTAPADGTEAWISEWEAARPVPLGATMTDAEIEAEVDRAMAAWHDSRAPLAEWEATEPTHADRVARVRARNADADDRYAPGDALSDLAGFGEFPDDFTVAQERALGDIDPMVAIAQHDHDVAVAARAEQLRIDAEARLLVAVERGGFGLFDPGAVVSVRDLAALGTPAPLIDGVLQRETLSMLFAEPYAGKSFLALDWSCRIATGLPWLGKAVTRGRVLYIAAEGQGTFAKRIDAWEAHNGVTVDSDALVIYPRTVNLLDASSVELLAAYQAREQFDLIVVDTLSRAISGADENSAEVMSALIAAASRLREAHEPSNVMLVHHTLKASPETYRGSSVLGAGLDTILCLKRTEKDEPTDPRRRLVIQKDKSGEAGAPINLVFEQVAPSAVLIEDATGGVDDFTAAILKVVADGADHASGAFYAECGATTDAQKQAVRRKLGVLVGAGLLVASGTTSAVTWRRP